MLHEVIQLSKGKHKTAKCEDKIFYSFFLKKEEQIYYLCHFSLEG